jgi:hypothetical protein
MLMQATVPQSSFDVTGRSFGSEPVACPSEYFRIRPMNTAHGTGLLGHASADLTNQSGRKSRATLSVVA